MQHMEEIRGSITRITYRHPTSPWKVGTFKPDGGGEIKIKGEIAESNLDLPVTIRGTWEEHPQYGRSFAVNNVLRSAPAGPKAMQVWLEKQVEGIGPGLAKRIVEHFGDETKNVIEESPEKLREVRGVSPAKALLIRTTWMDDAVTREVVLLLAGSGISDGLARKVTARFGTNAIQIIQTNPYRLTEVSGIGFKTADKMAFGMGWTAQRPERLQAGVVFLLNEATLNGHSFLHKSEVVSQLRQLAEITTDGGTTELLKETEALSAVNRAIETNSVKLETVNIGASQNLLCYLPKYYNLETELAERIGDILSTPHVPPPNIDDILSEVERELTLQLSHKQRSAVIDSLTTNCSIITGLPGTGKTSTVRALVKTAQKLGLSVALAAPTGRAAKRLMEVTGVPAMTIHRLLEYVGGEFLRNEKNKLVQNLVIIDESSMVDLELGTDVLRAISADSSIVWVGDENQLPSVGAGTVLRDLIGSKRIRTTVLDKIFRQAEGSMIIQNAHRIHKGDMPQFPAAGGEGDSFWVKVPRGMSERGTMTDSIDFVKEKLVQMYARFSQLGHDPIRDVQVLTPMKIGPAGYEQFNKTIQEAVNPDGARVEVAGKAFRIGDRVMQTKNNYDLEVYNGDVGHIADVIREEKKLVIEWSDRSMEYPFGSADDLALSYAVSTHKAQGSEFKVVVIVLTGHHYNMLDRNLLYTANTRAREMCVYLASQGAMERAVSNVHVTKRNSLLAIRIRHETDKHKKMVQRI